MFLFREYAACVLMALILAGLLVAACAIGYLLKVTSISFLRTIQALPRQIATLKRAAMSYNGRKVICTGTEPSVMSD